MTHLYEQEHGDVLLDSNDIRTLNIDWLRNNIGVVQQVTKSVRTIDEVTNENWSHTVQS